MKLEEYLTKIRRVSELKTIYVVGAGNYGRIIGKWLDRNGIKWSGYIDKSKEGILNNKGILRYENISSECFFVISSYGYRKELLEELFKHNVKREDVLLFDTQDEIYTILDDLDDIDRNLTLGRFHNVHEGERCFLVGNGPSLKVGDLEKIKKEFSFGCNSVYALYLKTNWRPTYYTYTDTTMSECLSENLSLYHEILKSKGVFSSLTTKTQLIKEQFNDHHFYFKTFEAYDNESVQFSTDCEDRVYTCGTVMYVMLQLAAYFGFRELYLMGVDFNFSVERDLYGNIKKNNVVNHNADIEKADQIFKEINLRQYGYEYIADVELQLMAYKAAKNYADEHGIKIYNATRGGKLEVFERVDFDSLVFDE